MDNSNPPQVIRTADGRSGSWLALSRLRPMTDTDIDVSKAWSETAARLPSGWRLEGLRCASEGLRVDQRSDDWIAVAVAADGTEHSHRASDPGGALQGLLKLVATEA